jgi:hypothetical protein
MPALARLILELVGCTVFGLVLTLAPLYLLLAIMGGAWTPYTCITEIHKKIINPLGFDFEISETDCDLLAKDAAVTVFASRTGRNESTPLFKYDPVGPNSSPEITAINRNLILITIPRVSSIFFRKYDWGDVSVRYKIGVIDYPTTPDQQ